MSTYSYILSVIMIKLDFFKLSYIIFNPFHDKMA